MKILFIGDPHLDNRTPISRADDYAEVSLSKLGRIKDICLERGIKTVVLTGDTFDKDNYDQPLYYINRVIAEFKAMYDEGITVYSIIGNHDLRHNRMEYFKQSPLHILFQTGFVKHLVKEDLGDIVLYGLDFTEKEKIKELNKGLDLEKINILTMHYATDNTIPYESISRDEYNKFNIVVSGHDHNYYRVSQGNKTIVLRPGSMIRRTKDKYNLERLPIAYEVEYLPRMQRFNVEEHKLTETPAEVVFKAQVFNEEVDYTRDSIEGLFTDRYFRKEMISLKQIIEDLPLPVTDKTKENLLEYIEKQGL